MDKLINKFGEEGTARRIYNLNNGIMLASGFFTTALALVLTLFHYLVCDRALMHSAIKDVEGFRKMGDASDCDRERTKCLEANKAKPSVCKMCPKK